MKKIILLFAALSISILGAMPAFVPSHGVAVAQNSSANDKSADDKTAPDTANDTANDTAKDTAKDNNAKDDDAQARDAKTQNFVGTVISLNGQRFILRDEKLDTWYHLDDQKQAGQFIGKRVLIVGVIDERSDMIHIMSIQESKG